MLPGIGKEVVDSLSNQGAIMKGYNVLPRLSWVSCMALIGCGSEGASGCCSTARSANDPRWPCAPHRAWGSALRATSTAASTLGTRPAARSRADDRRPTTGRRPLASRWHRAPKASHNHRLSPLVPAKGRRWMPSAAHPRRSQARGPLWLAEDCAPE